MEKINDTQAKEIVTTEVIVDADVLTSEINSLQSQIDEKTASQTKVNETYQKEIDDLTVQKNEKLAKIAVLKEIGVEPVSETLEATPIEIIK